MTMEPFASKLHRASTSHPDTDDALRRRAMHLLSSSRIEPESSPSEDVHQILHELRVHQIELEIQNENLRQAQLELALARDRFADLFDFAPVGYLLLDRNGTILQSNLTAATMLGVDRAHLVNQRITKFIAKESQDTWFLHQRQVFPQSTPPDTTVPRSEQRDSIPEFTKRMCRIQLRKSDGTFLAIRLESLACLDTTSRTLQCRTALIDVTATAMAEEAEDTLRDLNIVLRLSAADHKNHFSQSIKLLAEAVTHLGEGVMITDGQVQGGGRVLFVNEAFCNITGYRSEELVGQLPDMLHGKLQSFDKQRAYQRDSQERRPWRTELTSVRKDGTAYDAELSITPLFNAEGDRTHLVSILSDITARKQIERALVSSEERLVIFIEHAPCSIAMFDGQMRYLAASRRWITDYRLPITGVLGRCHYELCQQTPEHWREIHRRGMSGESTRADEECIRNPDGTYQWQRWEVLPWKNADGTVGGIIIFSEDITARKTAETRSALVADIRGDFACTDEPQVALQRACERFMAHLRCDMFVAYCVDKTTGQMTLNAFAGISPERAASIQCLEPRHVNVDTMPANDVPTVGEATLGSQELQTAWLELNDIKIYSRHPLKWHKQILGEVLFGARTRSAFSPEELDLIHTVTDLIAICLRGIQDRAALQKDELLIRTIFDTAVDAIVVIDSDGVIQTANPATEQMFGFTQDELIGQNVKQLMPPSYCDEHDSYVARYLQSGSPHLIGTGRDVMGRHKDGYTFPIGLAVSRVDHLGLFTGILRDISAIRELQNQVLEIAAAEGRRIGQELHDNIQQQLIGLSMLARTLADALGTRSPADVQAANRLASGIQDAAREVQMLAHGIVPVEIDANGLHGALSTLATSVSQQFGIECHFLGNIDGLKISSFRATHLYRIAQEAATNSIKHGNCNHIRIQLTADNDTITLAIVDDGVGIGENELKAPGIGLQIMKYRAATLGGSMRIARAEDGGTRVICRVPKS